MTQPVTFKDFLEHCNTQEQDESFQRDRFVGRKQQDYNKDDERQNARNSSINFVFKVQGWEIQPTIHAASQQSIRRPDLDQEDWKRLHRNVIHGAPKNIKTGEYLFFSRSFDQGYVAAYNRKRLRIVTVLPKGRGNPKDGTTKILVEALELEMIEVE